MRKTLRPVLICILAASALAGCSSFDLEDSLEKVNPFAKEEVILSGERRDLPTVGDPVAVQGDGQPIAVPAAVTYENWPLPGNNTGNASHSGGATRTFSTRISSDVGDDDFRSAAAPVIHQGNVLFYEPNGDISAFSLGGARRWQKTLRPENEDDEAVGGGVAAVNGTAYVASAYRKVAAFNVASGAEIWSVDLDSPARNVPAASGSHVFVVTVNNDVLALNASDGSELWRSPGIQEQAGLLPSSGPVISGNIVVVPYSSGEVVAFDVKTGKILWSDSVVRASRRLAVSGLSDVAGRPVADNGVVYVSGVAGRTVAISLKSGTRVWTKNIGSAYSPIVTANAVYVLDLNSRVVALDRKSGEIRWITSLPITKKKKKSSTWAGPALAGGQLWFGSSDEKLATVNASTGAITSTRDINEPVYVQAIAASGRVFIMTGDGVLQGY
ncbi:PQQ-binding-like beta-propeller repeat protein [Coralliovum pocilloporae]|uniref:outer membrane protein assembly factor BamB family protein n=1 Tax=Coralliovum pocilloporae TaxID=3066369 RepID=UPI0033079FBC